MVLFQIFLHEKDYANSMVKYIPRKKREVCQESLIPSNSNVLTVVPEGFFSVTQENILLFPEIERWGGGREGSRLEGSSELCVERNKLQALDFYQLLHKEL